MPKITIIIPVYKAEKHIHRSVDSLLSQSFRDWECILVVDGTPDSSSLICQQYSKRDSRFITIIKKNGGVSSARNVGLDAASGDYVVFLDSDDRLAQDALLILYNSMVGNAEMAILGASFEDEEGNKTLWRGFEDGKITKTDDYGSLLRYGTVWGKIYKRTIIVENGLRFNETICNGEDCLFFWNYLETVNTICTSSYCGYYYYKPTNVATLTNSMGDPYKWLQSYRLLKDEFDKKIFGNFMINKEDLRALHFFIASLARHALLSAYSMGIKRHDRKVIFQEYRGEVKNYCTKTRESIIEYILMSLPFALYDMICVMKNLIRRGAKSVLDAVAALLSKEHSWNGMR